MLFVYLLLVCHLSVTRVCCDKTAEIRITRFSRKSSVKSTFSLIMFDREIRRVLHWGSNWGGFRIRDAISRKRCDIEFRWQLAWSLIGSHIWAFDCNTSLWPWMTLNVNLLLCLQGYSYCDQTAEARITLINILTKSDETLMMVLDPGVMHII